MDRLTMASSEGRRGPIFVSYWLELPAGSRQQAATLQGSARLLHGWFVVEAESDAREHFALLLQFVSFLSQPFDAFLDGTQIVADFLQIFDTLGKHLFMTLDLHI